MGRLHPQAVLLGCWLPAAGLTCAPWGRKSARRYSVQWLGEPTDSPGGRAVRMSWACQSRASFAAAELLACYRLSLGSPASRRTRAACP
eukprot:scaffold49386_cov60-Phaeocystis_antarctica.AAC.5